MAQTFTHEEGNARLAAQHVDQAHGAIDFQIKNIELAVNQLQSRGWQGNAANKFYAVAAEMVQEARRLQNKMEEMRHGLEDVNRTYTEASDTMAASVNTINTYSINR